MATEERQLPVAVGVVAAAVLAGTVWCWRMAGLGLREKLGETLEVELTGITGL